MRALLTVALSAWLGAGLLFAAVVAPAAFRVLPSRALAGALAGAVLPVLFWTGAAVGVWGVLALRRPPARRWALGLAILLAATLVLILGLIDDFGVLTPSAKFIGQFLAAVDREARPSGPIPCRPLGVPRSR